MGKVFVITGTCGSGKTSLVEAVTKDMKWLERIVSCTTRKKHKGEKHGREYFFVSKDKFEELVAEHTLIEFSELYGSYYGALESELRRTINSDKCALVVPDVRGALTIKEKYPGAILIFVMAPSLAILRRRLIIRGSESTEIIEQKIKAAEGELRLRNEFEYLIVNDDLKKALNELKDILFLYI